MSQINGLTDEEVVERFQWKTDLNMRVFNLRTKGVRNLTFSVYRRGDISATHTDAQVNPPDEVQFDGVIFDDGTTVIHWNTSARSTSVFDSFDSLLEIHGHPEDHYATEFRFEGE
jgi:hypothetical protein